MFKSQAEPGIKLIFSQHSMAMATELISFNGMSHNINKTKCTISGKAVEHEISTL